jgi:hypothetical protein
MIRYLTVAWLLLVFAPLQVVLAEINVVVVTPESQKENLGVVRVKAEHDDKTGQFEVRLRLDKPQHVTTRLVIASGDTEQETFATASVVTESEATVRFSVPMKSIAHATLQLGVGGYNFKDGVATPWLGGTSYIIKLQDFTVGTAPRAARVGSPREPGGLVTGGTEPQAKSLRSGIDYLTQASAQGDELIHTQIKAKGLVEIHSTEDNIDTSRVVVFLGRHNKVEVRPGTSVFVELPRLSKEFYWQAGDAPEGVGDSELPIAFTHVWCRWSSNGTLKWTCLGPATEVPEILR